MTDDELLDAVLADQIQDADDNKVEQHVEEPVKKVNEATQYLGTKLGHNVARGYDRDEDVDKKMVEEKHLTRVGENIMNNIEVRDGWIDVDKTLLGERAVFYPEDWQFRIRPATVEAIRNWSTIDDENANSIDDVFNEIMKSCLMIQTPEGPKPWGNICSWDRFFFLLLIREYTFAHGESNIQYTEPCIECDNDVTFNLSSQSLMFELPDPEVMPMYDRETRSWIIDPQEYDVEEEPITLYVPTLEKDANIKNWAIARYQENRNRKIDNVFVRFLPWLAKKVNKDETVARKQIREVEMKFKSWDATMFSFMDDVLRNIIVMPSTKLTVKCPTCGEEVTSDIRFPNSIRDLFNVPNRHKKFGKK